VVSNTECELGDSHALLYLRQPGGASDAGTALVLSLVPNGETPALALTQVV